jgi:Zn-dependent protease with chaperone function
MGFENLIKNHSSVATSRSHPELYATVEKLAKKADIPQPTLRILNPSKLGSSLFETLLKAMPAFAKRMGGIDTIIINESYPEVTRMSRSTSRVTDEMRGLIAHEMGHIKRGDLGMLGTPKLGVATQYGVMVGTIAGLYFLRDYMQKNQGQLPSPDATETEPHQEKPKSTTLQTAMKYAQYTVAAVGGLYVGGVMARRMRHNMEFACDAFSNEVLGSGEPMKKALQNLLASEEKAFAKLAKRLPPEKVRQVKTFSDAIKKSMHPPETERIARL